MKPFVAHTENTAPVQARPVLEKMKSTMGFVPNVVAMLAESPAVVDGAVTLFGNLYTKGTLSPIEREIVAITISREESCNYCVAAHSTFAMNAKIEASTLEALRSGKALKDPKHETLRRTTLKALKERGWISQDDQQAFYNAGYSKEQLIEVIGWLGLKTITNFINHIAETPLDSAFSSQKWTR